MNLSNEHLIRRHVAERLAAAEAYHARRRVIDERRKAADACLDAIAQGRTEPERALLRRRLAGASRGA